MVLEPREKKNPNYFRFIRESILGNLSVTVFHSGHLSHLLKLPINPHRRRKTLTAGDFSGVVLFQHRPYHQVRKEEIFNFSQSTEERILATRRPRASLCRRLESQAPAREGAWGTFQPRTSTCGRLATLHLLLCHLSPKSAFFGVFFVSAGPLNRLSGDLR